MNTATRLGTLVLAGLFAAAAAGQVSVVPTDIQQPGSQPGEIGNLETPNKCDNCHGGYDPAVEPAHNWRGSMMAHAGRDPLFWATVAIAEQDFPGAGDLCLRCHASDGWLAGRSTPTDGSSLSSADADGVTCDLCHRSTDTDGSEWFGVMTPPFVANDGGSPAEGYYGSGMYSVSPTTNLKLGPYEDVDPNHDFLQSDFHRSADLCGTCHDVSNPVVGDLAPNHGAQVPLADGTFSGVPGAPVELKAAFNNFPFAYGVVERTYSEHQSSALATLRVSDYDTLPAELQDGAIQNAWEAAMASSASGDYVDGAPRYFTCQTCHMPPVTGLGCNKNGVPVRSDLPLHDLTGGGSWSADLVAYVDGQNGLVLGGGLSPLQLAALADGRSRAEAMLASAAALAIDEDENEVEVINLTGHKLLSGYPEGRRMWLNVKWYDGQGMLLREDGEYGPLAVQIGGQPAMVDTLLDPYGADTHVWQAHFGMTQDWAAALVDLGWPAGLALSYDRATGDVETTLGELAASAPGTQLETFHFVLNNVVIEDPRIPPYGFRYDDAQARNALPVPETQFGDPGPGGVYEHYDERDLNPPPGAVTATIDLLYQSTSWEYVQFLDLANDGSVTELAATGATLLDGWFATGMAAPELMATATWSAGFDPWTDLGGALAGTNGVPSLTGEGSLQGNTPVAITLADGLPDGTAWLVLGVSVLGAPFKGGVLVPSPDVLIGNLPLDATGGLVLAFTWPPGLPGGASLYWQYWIPDVGGPVGYAASNGLQSTTP